MKYVCTNPACGYDPGMGMEGEFCPICEHALQCREEVEALQKVVEHATGEHDDEVISLSFCIMDWAEVCAALTESMPAPGVADNSRADRQRILAHIHETLSGLMGEGEADKLCPKCSCPMHVVQVEGTMYWACDPCKHLEGK